MARDRSAAGGNPARQREEIYRLSVRFIEERAPRGEPGFGWKDTLDEIEETYGYKPYDVAYVLALTTDVHPRTRPRSEDQERAAAARERHAKVMELLARLQEELTAGDDRPSSAVILVEGPRTEWELLETRGRPADWHLDEFVGYVGVILGEARRPQARPEESETDAEGRPVPPADSYRQALTFACQLLRTTGILPREIGGRAVSVQEQRDALRQRFWRLQQKGDLPPRSDDGAPLRWIEALWRRLAEGVADPERRRFIAPTDAFPVPAVVHTTMLLPGQKVEWDRRRLHPSHLARLRDLLRDPADLAIAFAFTGLTAIAVPRGIRERLRQALGEPPAGPAPDPGPSADPPK